MMGRRAALSLLLSTLLSCSDCGRAEKDSETPEGEKDATVPSSLALEVHEVRIDAALAPRGSRPLIAGEAARISLRVRGGEPPYEVELGAPRQDGGDPGPPLFSAELEAAPEAKTAAGVEIAARVELSADARSGVYRVSATAKDRRGKRAQGHSEGIRIVGEGAELARQLSSKPRLEIVDAGGRRRRRFYRGELVTLRGELEGAGSVSVSVLAPDRAIVMDSVERDLEDGELSLSFSVPRLARPGVYSVVVNPDGRAEAALGLEVAGPAFPPATRLTVDSLSLYGGADLRTPRGAELRRGERLRVEARVGGGRRRVRATLRLRARDTEVAFEEGLGSAPIRTAAPDARVFVARELEVPEALAPGRYMLEIEASEDDDVSALYREVLVR